MARLTLENVSKRHPDGTEALREVSLEVPDGALFTLVGPSGCGKSTLLSLIAGLDRPTDGAVRIDGEVVNALAPGERDIAMVFQSYALYPHLTVAGNLAFPLEVARMPRRERDARVAEVAELLGLSGLLQRRPSALSGGQRQRVALGRALVRRPRLFLFDEPLSNLDAALRVQMRAELKALHQRLKATFIYVTHDQVEAMTLSDQVAVLKAGRLQQVGPPQRIYDAPANTFVAGFFGTPPINLMPPEALGLPEGGEGACVGVRPVDLELVAPGDCGVRVARVELIEPLGAESWVTVEVGGTRMVVRVPAGQAFSVGEQVGVRPRSGSRVHRFDAAGRRQPPELPPD
ncbi:MAG TPA: ABC transporter ATP-binding protein [Myxococcaceae bacterium]|nr:ABC transporter ATP-binding protein [Myxococcaceae bacterium]